MAFFLEEEHAVQALLLLEFDLAQEYSYLKELEEEDSSFWKGEEQLDVFIEFHFLLIRT